jgi:hypothetical protein
VIVSDIEVNQRKVMGICVPEFSFLNHIWGLKWGRTSLCLLDIGKREKDWVDFIFLFWY